MIISTITAPVAFDDRRVRMKVGKHPLSPPRPETDLKNANHQLIPREKIPRRWSGGCI